jgi:TRAP-type C4-dicarboxylate transport system permease small subunit
MSGLKMVGLVLIIVGALGLAYGGFSYTKDTTAVKLGSLELNVKERETFNVPLWVGVSAILVGAGLLVLGGKAR